MVSIKTIRTKYIGKKILVRGRAGKTKAFLYSEFNKGLLQSMHEEYMIHKVRETGENGNLPDDGYYIATVKSVYVDRKGQKRIDITDLKFLSDSPIGLVDIEPHLYSSFQVENILGRKVKTKSEILMLMMLLESSVNRPVTVVPQAYKMFARIVEDYNSQAWGDMWENIFSLQVMLYETTRYPYISELQVKLMDEYSDLEFNYESFIVDVLGDVMPTEEGLKELDSVIDKLLYTNGEEDMEAIDTYLGDYL